MIERSGKTQELQNAQPDTTNFLRYKWIFRTYGIANSKMLKKICFPTIMIKS